jgi:hypothetical protein
MSQKGWVRLATNLMDVPLKDFVWLYHQRWQIETVFNMLKNTIGASSHGQEDISIRSKLPELVYQDIYALAILHNLLCNQARRATEGTDFHPTDLSFSKIIEKTRLAIEGNWSYHRRLQEILKCRLPKRSASGRTYNRVVRPVRSKYDKTGTRQHQQWIAQEIEFATSDRVQIVALATASANEVRSAKASRAAPQSVAA